MKLALFFHAETHAMEGIICIFKWYFCIVMFIIILVAGSLFCIFTLGNLFSFFSSFLFFFYFFRLIFLETFFFFFRFFSFFFFLFLLFFYKQFFKIIVRLESAFFFFSDLDQKFFFSKLEVFFFYLQTLLVFFGKIFFIDFLIKNSFLRINICHLFFFEKEYKYKDLFLNRGEDSAYSFSFYFIAQQPWFFLVNYLPDFLFFKKKNNAISFFFYHFISFFLLFFPFFLPNLKYHFFFEFFFFDYFQIIFLKWSRVVRPLFFVDKKYNQLQETHKVPLSYYINLMPYFYFFWQFFDFFTIYFFWYKSFYGLKDFLYDYLATFLFKKLDRDSVVDRSLRFNIEFIISYSLMFGGTCRYRP